MSFGVPEVSCATTSSLTIPIISFQRLNHPGITSGKEQPNILILTYFRTNTAMMTACICIMYAWADG